MRGPLSRIVGLTEGFRSAEFGAMNMTEKKLAYTSGGRGYIGLALCAGSLRKQPKKFQKLGIWPELNSNKGRCAVRIVTFCPPALAIRLNGPGTANPPPPGGVSGPLFCLGHINHFRI